MAEGRAPARAALAGNPSDAFGGAVLAVALAEWSAHVAAEHSAAEHVEPQSRLVAATARRFARAHGTGPTSVHWRTTIPVEVGLGGSSALAIATTRALAELHEITVSEYSLAKFALAVEVEELGIAAGLQDRIAQAFGGLTCMDFATQRHDPLDPGLLPPLVVAHLREAGGPSGGVHAALRARHSSGERAVVAGLERAAELARRARTALEAGDREAFARCVDGTFDVRRELLELDPRCVGMIESARGAGAAANYTGSGGAIVAICSSDAHAAQVAEALARSGAVAVKVQPAR